MGGGENVNKIIKIMIIIIVIISANLLSFYINV